MNSLPSSILAQSFLSGLPNELVLHILTDSQVVQLPAGKNVPNSDVKSVAVVLDGTVRMFLQAPTGRQMTVRYARPGETLGLVHLFGGITRTRVQSVSPTRLCVLNGTLLQDLAGAHPTLAMAIARECAMRAFVCDKDEFAGGVH